MWQRTCFEQSNVLDVTIQCQLNVASKNVSEFSAMYTPPCHHQTSPQPNSARDSEMFQFNNMENVTPTKQLFPGEFDTIQRASGIFDHFPNCASNESRSVFESVNGNIKHTNSGYNVQSGHATRPDTGYFNSCMNDSGYSSPCFNQTRNYTSLIPKTDSVKPAIHIMHSSPTSVYQNVKFVTNEPSTEYQCNYTADVTQHPENHVIAPRDQESSISDIVVGPCEEMKIAMRERDLTQRLFTLGSRDSEAAKNLEQYYQSQTSIIDLERHNILCQMAYNKTSSDSINKYYNRKVLSVLEHVEQKLTVLEGSAKCKNAKKQPVPQKKSRLLPKHGVKLLETWYTENLENPYPSREVTLSMASEGDMSVEQIRKWFANKRNRSRNNTMKASLLNDAV